MGDEVKGLREEEQRKEKGGNAWMKDWNREYILFSIKGLK